MIKARLVTIQLCTSLTCSFAKCLHSKKKKKKGKGENGLLSNQPHFTLQSRQADQFYLLLLTISSAHSNSQVNCHIIRPMHNLPLWLIINEPDDINHGLIKCWWDSLCADSIDLCIAGAMSS